MGSIRYAGYGVFICVKIVMPNTAPRYEHLAAYQLPSESGPMGRSLSFKLPLSLDSIFRATADKDRSFYLRFAVLEFMLKHGWIEPNECPILPFEITIGDTTYMQLAASREDAIAKAKLEAGN